MGRTLGFLLVVVLLLAALIGAMLWLFVEEDPSGRVPPDAAAPLASRNLQATSAAGRVAEVPARVTGEVRRAGDGKPASGQRVVLEGVRPRARETETDERGAFEFAAVPKGGPYTVIVDATGTAEVRVPGVELKPGEVRDVGTLWLAPAVRVLVEVRTFAGDPLPGAVVEAYRVGTNAAAFEAGVTPQSVETQSTGSDGVARFPGLPVGSWTFVASRSGHSRRGSAEERLDAGDVERTFRIALERGFRIEGRVLSRAGDPVAGAAVVALRRTLTADAATAPITCRTVSDAQGRYALESLPAADVCIWSAWPQGRLAIVAAVRPPGVPHLDLALPDASYVTGRVTESGTATALAGVTVTAGYTILGGISQESEAVTDATGTFRVVLPMSCSLTTLSARRDGFLGCEDAAIAHAAVEMPEGATIVRDLAMRRGAALTGLVTGPDGPVAEAAAQVRVGDHEESTTTGRDGRYRFGALPAGPAVVVVLRRGLVQKDAPPGVQIPAEGGATCDIVLVAGGTSAKGDVTDAAGAPIEGARVTIVGDEHSLPVVTGKDGAFEVKGLDPGASTGLRASKEGFTPVEQWAEVPAEGAGAPRHIVLHRPRHVRGRVRSASGAPLADAYVQAGDAADGSGVSIEWQSLSMKRHPVLADGSFDVELEEDRDEVCVHAAAAGFARASSAAVRWSEDGAAPFVELVLQPAHSLSGVVRSTSGAPLPGANVAVFPRTGPDDEDQECVGAWGPAIVAVTDAAGRFTVADLAPGWWGVAAWSEQTLRGKAKAEVPCATEVVVTAKPSRSISGSLAFEDGGPVAGASVLARSDEAGEFRAVTDARGAFRVAGLPDGAFTLSASPGASSRANFVVATLEGVEAGASGVALTVARGLSIAGVLRWSDGRAADGVAVYFVAEGPGERPAVAAAYSRSDGSFEGVGLVGGRWTLHLCGYDHGGEVNCRYEGVPAGRSDVSIALPRRAEVSGSLVDETGRPLAGVPLRAVAEIHGPAAGRDVSEIGVDTGEDGTFSFWGLDSTRYRIQISRGEGVTLIDPEPLRPGSGPVRLVAKAGESITGSVSDGEGKPFAGVTVYAYVGDDGSFVRFGRTGADGSFEVRGLLPDTAITVSLESEDLLAFEPVPARSGTRGLKIVAARGLEITGVLLSAAGERVGGTTVFLTRTEGTSYAATTAEDGSFRFRGLPPGEWKATAQIDGRNGSGIRSAGTVRSGDRDVTLRAAAD